MIVHEEEKEDSACDAMQVNVDQVTTTTVQFARRLVGSRHVFTIS